MEKTKAAAYCRVSTDKEVQEGSYELQEQYFTNLINSSPSMELVGIYGDKGKSGLYTEGRFGLQQLMDVLFKQERPGRNEKIFRLYKFRTMTSETDKEGKLLPDKVRLTTFGKKLRSTSLDELPELFNILKGDMAVVGPRPLMVKYLPRYNKQQARRHEVRPGFTGLAQVHGRNSISWEEKFNWDIEYVDKVTFLGDWKIIFMTVATVLKRDGISSAGEATTGEFMGNVTIKEK